MKGDYYRCLAEFQNGSNRKEAVENTLSAYKATQVLYLRTVSWSIVFFLPPYVIRKITYIAPDTVLRARSLRSYKENYHASRFLTLLRHCF
ncbi:hypothetical protein CsatB_002930 [Cannabis sativa]